MIYLCKGNSYKRTYRTVMMVIPKENSKMRNYGLAIIYMKGKFIQRQMRLTDIVKIKYFSLN